ncbi:MAG: hydantoin racemase [Hyphomicrobiales bacterium]|nr:hydantoin racemase [Hyphomicrobiales bacterium]
MALIVIINANSSHDVTESMDACLDIVRTGVQHTLQCVTLAEAPEAIEDDDDIRTVVPLLVAMITRTPADAYVIGCFSDPGLAESRRATARPVIGIGEAAYLEALGLGERFGIVSILEESVSRHAAHVARLGLSSRLAGDRSIGTGVAGLSDDDAAAKIITVGRQLRDEDGAEVLVLGCAGMGQHRAAVERELGIRVVDPVQAAGAQAASMLTLGYTRGVA